MWTVRLALFGLFVPLLGVSGFLLRHRSRYEKLLENRAVNLTLVASYNLLCYLMVGLPPDPSVFAPPAFLTHPSVRFGFSVAGQVLIVSAAVLMVVAVIQRKALGGQDVEAGLLTSGVYRYSRHPIYSGIISLSLGLALAAVNWDGLLMFPAVVLVNGVQAAIEEKYDVGVRFRASYEAYRRRTKMLGPIWYWAALGGILSVLVLIPCL